VRVGELASETFLLLNCQQKLNYSWKSSEKNMETSKLIFLQGFLARISEILEVEPGRR
jgi:hypothetical protein